MKVGVFSILVWVTNIVVSKSYIKYIHLAYILLQLVSVFVRYSSILYPQVPPQEEQLQNLQVSVPPIVGQDCGQTPEAYINVFSLCRVYILKGNVWGSWGIKGGGP